MKIYFSRHQFSEIIERRVSLRIHLSYEGTYSKLKKRLNADVISVDYFNQTLRKDCEF